jgi:hypothetical protein
MEQDNLVPSVAESLAKATCGIRSIAQTLIDRHRASGDRQDTVLVGLGHALHILAGAIVRDTMRLGDTPGGSGDFLRPPPN